ncbi:MAG: uroporphyrinogen decarboxylase [Gammaproteobacteria bacterium]|jgi:uroporphyrinogen decarboxylase|nr:uroporphyrinogen decarboxylase [Gammaproteobacteria bacterium]
MNAPKHAVLKNDMLLRALLREPTPRRPIWLMRQAGRYLPEYRATRAQAGGFLEMCTNPEIACEITLQPVNRFPLDAAILFSDILTIPHAMNLGLEFEAGEGPKFERPVRSAADIDKLGVPDPGRELKYVVDAVARVRRELGGRVPLIGFAGSPWTVATYMVEGGGSKTFGVIKRMMYEAPRDLHRLLEILAQSTILYLNAQIAAGAQAVMVFDTWGGVLTPAQYQEFSLRYMAQVIAALTREADGRRVPNIVFTKGGGPWLDKIAAIGCDAAGVDWTTDLKTARQLAGGKIALQGNLDPSALFAPPEVLRTEALRVLDSYGPGSGHVFNLGHGITPEVDPERVALLVETVQSYKVSA